MKLTEAKLCPDCEEIFSGQICPICDRNEGMLITNFGIKPINMPCASRRILLDKNLFELDGTGSMRRSGNGRKFIHL